MISSYDFHFEFSMQLFQEHPFAIFLETGSLLHEFRYTVCHGYHSAIRTYDHFNHSLGPLMGHCNRLSKIGIR